MEDKSQIQKKLNIELKEDIAQGIYSNLVIVTHSASEFILDFVRIVPGISKAQVKSRVIVTPDHAKRLVATIQENVKKYESVHGEIKMNMNPIQKLPLNFGGPTGEA